MAVAEWPKYDKRRLLQGGPFVPGWDVEDGRKVVMNPDGRVGYSMPADAGTPERFLWEYQNQFNPPQYATEIMALFMFGPMHGKSMRLGQNVRNEVMLACPPKVEPRFEPYESREEMLNHMRTNVLRNHRYRRLDQFSSAQGEDVTLFIHAEDCCDEMLRE